VLFSWNFMSFYHSLKNIFRPRFSYFWLKTTFRRKSTRFTLFFYEEKSVVSVVENKKNNLCVLFLKSAIFAEIMGRINNSKVIKKKNNNIAVILFPCKTPASFCPVTIILRGIGAVLVTRTIPPQPPSFFVFFGIRNKNHFY